MRLQITKEEVLARWTNGPRWAPDSNEEEFLSFYIEPVSAFGLSVREDVHPGMESWKSSGDSLPSLTNVPVDQILHSTQKEGVLLSILAQVINDGSNSAPCDPEGWYGNRHPVLLEHSDGTYRIRDGNHRCIGARLRGDAHVKAHVIKYDYAARPQGS